MAESTTSQTRWLLSLPAASAAGYDTLFAHRSGSPLFVGSDPKGKQLGSGAGTAHLLVQAWLDHRATTGENLSLEAWLMNNRKLLVHGSGESRRLPAYAAIGKPLTPVPVLRELTGQRMDQTLADLQFPSYERLLRVAPERYRLMIACGDVLLRFNQHLPAYPEADILMVGLPASPEEAQHHGVMACEPGASARMACFVQKPSLRQMQDLSSRYTCYLDSGIWLLGERALIALMERCGWNREKQSFDGGMATAFDLYAQAGPSLGHSPVQSDPIWGRLSAAVLPLPDGRFYHFGTSRSLLTSVYQLQEPEDGRRSFGHAEPRLSAMPVITLNSRVESGPKAASPRMTWIENSVIPETWSLSERHVLTGIPDNDWNITLEAGVCLDIVPTANDHCCVRFYGFDDPFRGAISNSATVLLGRPLGQWLERRNVSPEDIGVPLETDIFDAPLFPELRKASLDARWIRWLTSESPDRDEECSRQWRRARRISGRQLLSCTDHGAVLSSRTAFKVAEIRSAGIPFNEWGSRVDVESAADFCSRHACRPPLRGEDSQGLAHMRQCMFESGLLPTAHRSSRSAPDSHNAFRQLRNLLLAKVQIKPSCPVRNVLEDQIVWGRAPIRLDLAGGWTDTPPYCLEHGGRVVNVATDINGQPPIQVFARWIEEPVLVLRSIDLGIEERISSLDELRKWAQLGSGFGISKAALALCGLDPQFSDTPEENDLAKHLRRTIGGGLALSMLAAIPKGSGLGTSSILAATVLGTLAELLGLNWTVSEQVLRTLVLEQMLTSGGGWQDQVGGITRGLKLIETQPGIVQDTVLRWLPGTFFSADYANRTMLLYYTGLTRVAHDILGEIVRGFFVNRAGQASIMQDIKENASFAADAVQRHDWSDLAESVRRSWILNRLLDRGTNPPEVEAIVSRISDHAAALKLLGAGGGGYLLIMAKDEEAGRRIRNDLTNNPPNARARWVNMSLSETGLQVTRS